MALIADLLLIAAALGAAFYCFTLSRRLSALNSAEGGIGKAIQTLSDQVTRLERTLEVSRERAEVAEQGLHAALERAEHLQTMISEKVAPAPEGISRSGPKAPLQRAETQPASFRRRLFSEPPEETQP